MNHAPNANEVAVERHKIIAPIVSALEEGSDYAKIQQIKAETIETFGVSRRTLGRWLDAYTQRGFEGLKPMPKNARPVTSIPDSLVDEAVLLRREVPSRSVDQIIGILEAEGKTPKGAIRRSTLQDRLQRRGYSSAQMKLYNQKSIAARRFARKERNEMWQSDIKFGPVLTIGGNPTRTYMVAFIDDATRYIVHAEFYDNQEQTVVEDCLRKAILKEGIPRRLFFDNGAQYKTTWMHRACAVLGIQLIFAAPYSPEAKGKIERFNRTIDSFLAEVALKKPKNLDELNQYFKVWLSECYQIKEHSAINMAPEIAYKSSKTPLRFPNPEIVASAFLRFENRKVDKSGCINFGGKKYEVGVTYIGKTVGISYDAADTSVITVEDRELGKPFTVKELVIGEHTGPRPKLPERLLPQQPETSRLLDASAKSYEKRQLSTKRAISYAQINRESIGEGTADNV